MSLQDWFYLGVICFLGACSPGPSLLVVLGFVSSEGKKAGISVSIGHGVGVFLYALLSTLGLGVLITHYSVVFNIVQIVGAIFLLWIGCKIAVSSFSSNTDSSSVINYPKNNSRFLEGLLVAVLNPKIGIFFISLFSQFLSPDQTIVVQSAMALMAGGIDTIVYCAIVLLASTKSASNLLKKYKIKISIIFAILLILLAFSLFLSLVL
tara:strand:+ start:3953 stop:4576 length:624 start_codon:yes stop_codon:yes gene_type:complete